MISIIIPCYNTLDFLKKNIPEILRFSQSCCGEVIVIDDGSYENIEEYIKKNFKHQIEYYKQKNSGVAAARNKGIELANNDQLIFLDSDDSLDYDALLKKFDVIINSDFCFWGAVKIFPSGKKIYYKSILCTEPLMLLRSLLSRKQQIFIGGFSVRRDIAHQHLFDVRYKYGEDIKFICEVIAHSKKVEPLKGIYLNYHQHEESAINKFSENRFDSLHAIKSINLDKHQEILSQNLNYLLKRDRIVILRSLCVQKNFFDLIQYSKKCKEMEQLVFSHFCCKKFMWLRFYMYILSYKLFINFRKYIKTFFGLFHCFGFTKR